MNKKYAHIILALALLNFGLAGCGDNSTGTTEEEPPSLPNLEYSQPDVSYFENTTVKAKAVSDNFLAAKNTVLSYSIISNIGLLYANIINSAPQSDASFEDGVWEWTYSYSFEGTSSETRITAEESGNSISWAVYLSFSDGEVSFEDYKLMEGTTQNDGLTGNWTFNSLEAESNTPIPFLTSSWVTDGESESEITIKILDEGNSGGDINISYEKTGADFLMLVTQEGAASENVEIGWNSDTNLGYIQIGSEEPLCWDSSNNTVVDISCSNPI